jgi:hypothetical protein
MTKDEYMDQLKAYTVSKMSEVPEGRHSLRFWADFNNKCQEEFDASLAAQGIIVE